MQDYMNREEINRNVELAKSMLVAAKSYEGDELSTSITDGIANLLILGQESEVNIVDAVMNGVAHYLATYIEGMEPQQAGAWLEAALFPFTGERQFAEYVASKAIVLAGGSDKIKLPEWGV